MNEKFIVKVIQPGKKYKVQEPDSTMVVVEISAGKLRCRQCLTSHYRLSGSCAHVLAVKRSRKAAQKHA